MLNNENYSNSSNKTKVINIRCTPYTYAKLKSKARQRNRSASECALEYIEAGLKRRGKGEKDRGCIMVKQVQRMNDIIRQLTPEEEHIRASLMEYAKGDMELWRS